MTIRGQVESRRSQPTPSAWQREAAARSRSCRLRLARAATRGSRPGDRRSVELARRHCKAAITWERLLGRRADLRPSISSGSRPKPIIAWCGELVMPPERFIHGAALSQQQRDQGLITVLVNVTEADANSFCAAQGQIALRRHGRSSARLAATVDRMRCRSGQCSWRSRSGDLPGGQHGRCHALAPSGLAKRIGVDCGGLVLGGQGAGPARLRGRVVRRARPG